MKAIYYHNPKCSKSRQGLEMVKVSGIDYEIKEYLKVGLKKTELKELLLALKLEPLEVIRKKEKLIKSLEIDLKVLNKDQLIDLMVEHPVLLERPILLKGKRAVIGRPSENLEKLF